MQTLSSSRCARVAPFRHCNTSRPVLCRVTAAASCSSGSSRSTSLVTAATWQASVQQQQRRWLSDSICRALDNAEAAFDYEEPETAKEGIDLGLVLCKQGKWQQALGVFEKSLTLPGTGVKRFRDKPKLISDGEKMALLYNIACCHSQLQDARSGLVALGGCLEAGYTDFGQIRTDPDLDFLRTDSRFEGLLARFEQTGSGIMGGFNLGGLFRK